MERTTISPITTKKKIIYPQNDGKPILFADDAMVLVAGDLLWYPVISNRFTRMAPDVMVVFGRPKDGRSPYQQWQEGGIAPKLSLKPSRQATTP